MQSLKVNVKITESIKFARVMKISAEELVEQIEDEEDLAAYFARRDEETVSLEEILRELSKEIDISKQDNP